MGTKKKSGSSGFTMLELLLGLSIFAGVAVIVFSTFWTGIKMSRNAAAQNAAAREAAWAVDEMAKELENATPYDFSNSYPEYSAFTGTQDKITFLGWGNDGLIMISYYLAAPRSSVVRQTLIGQTTKKNVNIVANYSETSRTAYLIREERGFIDYLSSGSEGKGQTEIIASNIEEGGLKFSYGYTDKKNEGQLTWRDSFKSKDAPLGVTITVDFMTEVSSRNRTFSVTRKVLIPDAAEPELSGGSNAENR